MGSGVSSEFDCELTKPLDASDVNPAEAVAEVKRLRGLLAKYAAAKGGTRSYLDWREVAHAEPQPPKLESRSSVTELGAECKGMMERVLGSLKEGVFVQDGPPIPLLMEPDADWSGFAPWLLARVQAGNALGRSTSPLPAQLDSP